jgi:hypothetical protein
LVRLGRDGRFDPPAGRVLGFTRHARRKGQSELVLRLLLPILSPSARRPPGTTCHCHRSGLGPRGRVIPHAGSRPLASGHVARTTMPSADFCHAIIAPCGAISLGGTWQTSRGKFDRCQRTAAGFTLRALDGYGLGGLMPAGPALAPQIRSPFAGPRLCLALLSDLASRRRPWGRLSFTSIRLDRDLHPELSNMLGTHENGQVISDSPVPLHSPPNAP